MNPLTIIKWVLDNWVMIFIAALMVTIGTLSYQLKSAQDEVQVLTLEKKEREERDALRAAQNLRNKERTDEEFTAARRRAAVASVRPQPAGRVHTAKPVVVAGGGADSAACFDRRKLDEELAGFAERAAERLNQVIAELSRRNAERLSRNAQQGEEVAAAFRACRAWSLNLSDAPGRDGDDRGVGGIALAPSLPVPHYFNGR